MRHDCNQPLWLQVASNQAAYPLLFEFFNTVKRLFTTNMSMWSYLRNYTFKLHKIFVLVIVSCQGHGSVFLSGGVAIRYVLPGLRMTSYLHTARGLNRGQHVSDTMAHTQIDPQGASTILGAVRYLCLYWERALVFVFLSIFLHKLIYELQTDFF